jgi:hypothetical protein
VIRKIGIPQEILLVIQKNVCQNEAHVKIGNRITTGFKLLKD